MIVDYTFFITIAIKLKLLHKSKDCGSLLQGQKLKIGTLSVNAVTVRVSMGLYGSRFSVTIYSRYGYVMVPVVYSWKRGEENS